MSFLIFFQPFTIFSYAPVNLKVHYKNNVLKYFIWNLIFHKLNLSCHNKLLWLWFWVQMSHVGTSSFSVWRQCYINNARANLGEHLCQKPVLDIKRRRIGWKRICHWGVAASSSCCRCSINLDTRRLWRAQRSFLDSHNRPPQPIYSSELHLRCTVRQSHIVTPNNSCHQQQQSPQRQTETADSSGNAWFMSENCTILTFKHRAQSGPRHVVPNLNNPFFFTNRCRRNCL